MTQFLGDTPIYDQLMRELYAQRTREAYAASPGMRGCGQWELPPKGVPVPSFNRKRKKKPSMTARIFDDPKLIAE